MNNCIVCGNNEHALIFKKGDYDVVRCNKCGMVHIEPMPTVEEANKYYQVNGKAQYSENYIKNNINKTYFEGRFEFYKNLLSKYFTKGNNILDIGCHCGEFLRVLRAAKFDVYGLEVSKSICKAVEKNLNIPVYNTDISQLNIDKKFDFISALSVLEHTPNPDNMMRKIHDLLKDEGYLLLEVPNVDSYESQAILFLFAKNFNYWFHPTPPMHLYEFNKITINTFLQKHGFEIIEIGTAQPFEYDGDTVYTEGYYVHREGLSLINLETEKTNLLNKIVRNRDSYKDNVNIDNEVMVYIGRKLISTLFKEIAPFSKAADNRTGIWLLAKKIKSGNKIDLEKLNKVEEIMSTIDEGWKYVITALGKNDIRNSAVVFNDIILAMSRIEELIGKFHNNLDIELIEATKSLNNLINRFVNYYDCSESEKLKSEILNLVENYNVWSLCIKKLK